MARSYIRSNSVTPKFRHFIILGHWNAQKMTRHNTMWAKRQRGNGATKWPHWTIRTSFPPPPPPAAFFRLRYSNNELISGLTIKKHILLIFAQRKGIRLRCQTNVMFQTVVSENKTIKTLTSNTLSGISLSRDGIILKFLNSVTWKESHYRSRSYKPF